MKNKNDGDGFITMKQVNKGIKVRIYPNQCQEEQFQSNFGACRFVYNNILEQLNKLYQLYPKQYNLNIKLINTFLNQLKQEFDWLYGVESTSLQQSSRDLLRGYLNFFKNPKTNFPKFHSKKHTRLSFRQTVTDNLVQGKYLNLRKYGLIRYRTSKEYVALLNSDCIKINNVTVSYDNGQYYAVLSIIAPVEVWEHTNKVKGYDLNSNKNSFLVSNAGEKYSFDVDSENQRIKDLNKVLSTKQEGSRGFKRIQRKLQRVYTKRTNKLNDFIQKLSTALVKENDVIVIEDNWSSIKILIGGEQNMVFPLMHFQEMIMYKFDWYKSDCIGLVMVNPMWTSKMCHHCGFINSELTCDVREWFCPVCGSILDRDINASINILNRWDNGDLPFNTKLGIHDFHKSW